MSRPHSAAMAQSKSTRAWLLVDRMEEKYSERQMAKAGVPSTMVVAAALPALALALALALAPSLLRAGCASHSDFSSATPVPPPV